MKTFTSERIIYHEQIHVIVAQSLIPYLTNFYVPFTWSRSPFTFHLSSPSPELLVPSLPPTTHFSLHLYLSDPVAVASLSHLGREILPSGVSDGPTAGYTPNILTSLVVCLGKQCVCCWKWLLIVIWTFHIVLLFSLCQLSEW